MTIKWVSDAAYPVAPLTSYAPANFSAGFASLTRL